MRLWARYRTSCTCQMHLNPKVTANTHIFRSANWFTHCRGLDASASNGCHAIHSCTRTIILYTVPIHVTQSIEVRADTTPYMGNGAESCTLPSSRMLMPGITDQKCLATTRSTSISIVIKPRSYTYTTRHRLQLRLNLVGTGNTCTARSAKQYATSKAWPE